VNIELVDTIIRWLGGLLAYATLAILFYGIWRGTRRQAGLTTGHTGTWLRSLWFYLASSALFFGLCYFGWSPLPLTISPSLRAWMLALGSLLYFPGIFFVLWGWLVLGKNYFVSTGFGAQLFAGHQLVTNGPFAIVRHPMYTGIFLAALGSLLIYPTWTTILFAFFAPMTSVRARREEAALAEEFGEQWQAYCCRVPAFFPRFNRKGK
jgi:protein-S-isoprenylcysteine O-methyltransferase Ste14